MKLKESILSIFLTSLAAVTAQAATFQELYPVQEEQITTLQQMSECRAVMEYYASYIGIGYMVNEQVLEMKEDSKPQRQLAKLVERTVGAANKLMHAQRDFVSQNLQEIPEEVTVEIAQTAFYESLERITMELTGPRGTGDGQKKNLFLRKYEDSYKKCGIFLHD